MVPKDQNNLICLKSGCGPTFGNGHDLHISNDCYNNRLSCANFPTQYNKEGEAKYINNQESYRMFSGATSGHFFRVVEYEVFSVVY